MYPFPDLLVRAAVRFLSQRRAHRFFMDLLFVMKSWHEEAHCLKPAETYFLKTLMSFGRVARPDCVASRFQICWCRCLRAGFCRQWSANGVACLDESHNDSHAVVNIKLAMNLLHVMAHGSSRDVHVLTNRGPGLSVTKLPTNRFLTLRKLK